MFHGAVRAGECMSPSGASGGRPRAAGLSSAANRAPALIGRERELATLDEHLRAVGEGAFRVALVVGSAGIGKTRLAAEALDRHAADGALALSARSYRWGGTTSFGPWVEALDRDLRSRPTEDLRQLCTGLRSELAALLPSVEVVTGPADRHTDRSQLLEALVGLLDRLSRERPVLVALDDVHLADPSTWEVLRYLGRRLSGSPIGVIATARPSELAESPIAGEVLVGLEDDGMLVRLPLQPLTLAQVTALAHEVLRADTRARSTFVPAPLVSWLVERSVGHPLFAIGLLEALIEEGADLTQPRLEHLPTGLRDRVALDLARLEGDQRHLLEVLAVADRRMEIPDVERVADLAPPITDALERLVRLRLVTEQRNGAELSVEISHPIVQDAIYEEIAESRRRGLHRRVGRTLAASGQLGSAAGHFARAADRGDDEAVEALCQAMAQAEARGLHQEALAILAALLDVLPADDARWLEVFEAIDPRSERVLSHLAENDVATAIAAMERIEGHLDGSEDLVARATVRFHLAAFLSFGAGRLAAAERACRTAADLYERAGDREGALLAQAEVGWIHGCGGDLLEQWRIASDVLEAAERDDHRQAATQAAAIAAYAAGFLGRFEQADELFGRALVMAQQGDNSYRAAWIQAQHGGVLSLSGRLDDGLASVESALRTDPRAPDALAFEVLAQGLWLRGGFDDAVSALERSAIRRPLRGSRRRAWGAALGARIHAERGHLGRARASLEVAAATYGDRPFLVWGFWSPWVEAVLRWIEDRPAAALDGLAEVAGQLADQGSAPYEILVLVDLAEAAADAGDHDNASQAAARAETLAGSVQGVLSDGCAALVGALAALTAGDHGRARGLADTAARTLADAGFRPLAATAQHVLGRALGPADRGAAIVALETAASTFDDCAAVWRRDRVMADLVRQGSQGRRHAASLLGPAALTTREREVAMLAVQGLTAREIGGRLFIGRRTVESHLAACYAKLGVASKRELIQRAAELDLAVEHDAP